MEMSKFQRFNLALAKYFMLSLPVMFIDLYFLNQAFNSTIAEKASYSEWQVGLMAVVFILGLVIQLYLTAMILFSKTFRELAIAKLSGFKLSDEREEQITLESARSTHIIILATLITLFFFNSVTFELGKRPQPNAEGKTGYITLGMNLNLFTFNQAPAIQTKSDLNDSLVKDPTITKRFIYNGLPINTQQLILLLIILQMYFFRRSFSVRSQL